MIHITSAELDHAFIPKGCLMFSGLIENLSSDPSLSAERARDMCSGLRRIAKALNRPVSDIPADPKWLQPRLNKVQSAALGLSRKSWQNILSDARGAMVHSGLVRARHRHIDDLSPRWRALWENVLASNDKTLPSLCRFVHFLDRRGIAPNDVTEGHARDYFDAISLNEISKSPDTTYRAAVNNWNLAVTRIPDWPQITLKLPSRQKKIVLPEGTLPRSFHEDLDRTLEGLAKTDPFGLQVYQKPLRAQTLHLYRCRLLRFAADLVHSGICADRIENVEVLCMPDMAERGLKQMLSRTEDQRSSSISEMAELLHRLARSFECGERACEQLAEFVRKLKMPARKGMTQKNRDRLRVLQAPATQLKLLQLPDKLLMSSKKDQKPFTIALKHEDAIAIAILLVCPIRVGTLAQIHLERHVHRPGNGRAYLVFEAEDLKAGNSLEFELPREIIRMIDGHLKTRSPELCPSGTPWLFPRRDGVRPVNSDQLASRIKRRIARETGLEMNAHLFRHFAVMIWLDANPGSYEAVRRLLGHSEVSQTINMYSGLEVRSAMQAYSDLVSSTKGRLK